jgi:ABC-type phosphate/phosphonate transport system substrate-binding protein
MRWIKHPTDVTSKEKTMNKLLGAIIFALVSQLSPIAQAADDLASPNTSYSAQQEALISRYLSNTAGLGATGVMGENYATIDQASDANQAVIYQYGSSNRAMIEQSGGVNNIAMITQSGDNNYGSISQRGNNNLALINQR